MAICVSKTSIAIVANSYFFAILSLPMKYIAIDNADLILNDIFTSSDSP